MILNCSDFVRLFGAWRDAIEENKEYLIKLDSVGGDGDLGLAMSDGFNAIVKMLEEKEMNDIGILLYNTGKTMSVYAPSSLGTLLSFGLMDAGKALKGNTEIPGSRLGDLLEAFENGIAVRGKAKVGEKTFIDGFDPAVQVMKAVTSEDEVASALRKAAVAAKAGSDSTIDMVAKYGRIAVRGEESRGILDPGSVVASILISAMADTFAPEN